MPWKETCVMDQRMRFIVEYDLSELPVRVLCRKYGISPKTAYKWLYRADALGLESGLKDLSRRPHAHPNRVSAELEQAVVSVRLAHPTWGPRKLRALLERQDGGTAWPAASTIGEVLQRHNLVRPRKRRRRTPPYTEPFAAAQRPNDVWCADFKGWFCTGDGQRCDPLTISDARSRYLLRCQVLEGTDFEVVQPAFEETFKEYGLPWAIRTDNGPPFATRALKGLSRLSLWWLRLGIVPERIEAGHPEQNGRHERMHLTLKKETASPPCGSRLAQQRRFNRFRREFNEERPHEALEMRTPAWEYRPSARAYPRKLPEWEYPLGMTVRQVSPGGRFRWRCGNVFLSHALDGETIGLWPLDDRHWQLWVGPLELGVLDARINELLTERQRRRMEAEGTLVCPSSFRCAPGPRADKHQTVLPMCPV
jgi:transposase InsO family protein